jgi:ethanolamine utilization protein EutN
MLLARVEGNVTVALGHPSLRGWPQLICQPFDAAGQPDGMPLLAIDRLGAGRGDTVMLTSDGKSIRQQVGDDHSPLRYQVIAIIDAEEGQP